MSDWARVANTTIRNYFRDVEVNILRNRKLTGMLEQKGRFKFNASGLAMNWPVRYKRVPMQGYTDSESLTFPRHNRWKKAELDWRGYTMSDSCTSLEREKNKGNEQIINIFSEMAQGLEDDFQENFASEFYIDGNVAANVKRIHGIESFLGSSGVGTFVATNSDTFAGLSTALAAYGGTWGNGTWPNGSGDDHYDFWSSLLIDYTNASWDATTKTWPNTCIEALRFGIIQTQRNKSRKGKLDMIMVDREMYRQFLNRLDEKERIQTMHNASNSLLVKLGYSDVVVFDGVDITWEYGSPVGVGYGFNCDMMQFRSLFKKLIRVNGPTYDVRTDSWLVRLDALGNCTWNPRFFLKLADY